MDDFLIEDYERPLSQKEVLVTNRAFLYGEAATTCSLLRNKGILFVQDHLCRLEKSWTSFYPQCPRSLLRGKLLKNIKKISHFYQTPQNGQDSDQDHYVKIALFTNDQKRHFDRTSSCRMPNIIIFGDRYSPPPRPVELKSVVRTTPPERNLHHKTPSYLCQLNHRMALESDVLYVDSSHHVLEASVSNAFFVINNTVVTPPLSPFILAGIARKHFLEFLKEQQIPFCQAPVHRSDLKKVDEVFLSNSLSLVTLVNKLDNRPLQCHFSSKLKEMYSLYCQRYFSF